MAVILLLSETQKIFPSGIQVEMENCLLQLLISMTYEMNHAGMFKSIQVINTQVY